jgi:hypothetical protein
MRVREVTYTKHVLPAPSIYHLLLFSFKVLQSCTNFVLKSVNVSEEKCFVLERIVCVIATIKRVINSSMQMPDRSSTVAVIVLIAMMARGMPCHHIDSL